jgi:hypothetical protein
MRRFLPPLLLLGIVLAAAAPPPGSGAGGDKSPAGKAKPRFTVGKDTTYVTGPVDKDGRIDYVTALNERLRSDIKPEDNCNALLFKAFGPRPEGGDMPPAYFKWLGIEPPPADGTYYSGIYLYVKKHIRLLPEKRLDEIFDQQSRCSARPWTAQQYPIVAGWLKQNDRHIDTVVEATMRPRFYNPLVTSGNDEDNLLVGALLPSVQKCRDFAQALSCRAMLRLGERRYDDAWQDLLACHRLGRHIGSGGTLIEKLVGIAIEHIVSQGELAYLEAARPDAKKCAACLEELRKLPPLPSAADSTDLCERLLSLDIVVLLAKKGPQAIPTYLLGGAVPPGYEELAKKVGDDVDWDSALRAVNEWFDRLTAAMRLKERPEREKQLGAFEKELKQLKASLSDPEKLGKLLLGKDATPQTRGKVIGDIVVVLLVPGVRKVQLARDRDEQLQRNMQLAFALAAYRADHGAYPRKLDDLAPTYVPAVPGDLFASKAMTYLAERDSYLLYSFGPNGRDDQGRFYDDSPPGDDIRVRMPLPPVK